MTGPTQPYAEVNDDGPNFDDLNPMERTIQSTLHESKDAIGADQPITDRPRNAAGQFVAVAEAPKQPGEWHTIPDPDPQIAAIEGAIATTEGEPAEPAAPIIPEGHVALPALAPEKVQGFKVLDTEGEIVAPDLKFEVNFRGPNGEAKPRTLDLPQLVNYARMGVYNHEREQVHEQAQREVQQWRTSIPQIEQAIKDRDARYDRLLSDPQFLASELQRYDTENTPEARAERERNQIAQEREAWQFEQMTRVSQSFVDDKLAPALESVARMFPHVSQEELAAKLFLAADPYRVNGVLHPNHFTTIANYIVHELYPWAEQLHTHRDESKPKGGAPTVSAKKPDVADPEKEKLQVRAQRARRTAVAALKPAGGNGQPQGPPAQQKPPRTGRDMEELVVTRSLAGSRTG